MNYVGVCTCNSANIAWYPVALLKGSQGTLGCHGTLAGLDTRDSFKVRAILLRSSSTRHKIIDNVAGLNDSHLTVTIIFTGLLRDCFLILWLAIVHSTLQKERKL